MEKKKHASPIFSEVHFIFRIFFGFLMKTYGAIFLLLKIENIFFFFLRSTLSLAETKIRNFQFIIVVYHSDCLILTGQQVDMFVAANNGLPEAWMTKIYPACKCLVFTTHRYGMQKQKKKKIAIEFIVNRDQQTLFQLKISQVIFDLNGRNWSMSKIWYHRWKYSISSK